MRFDPLDSSSQQRVTTRDLGRTKTLPVSVDSADDEARDAPLLLQLARGERAALGYLYDRHAPGLLRCAWLFDPQDAEDLLQATFLQVVATAPQFAAGPLGVRPWLFATLARVAQERRRGLLQSIRALARRSHRSAAGSRVAAGSGLTQALAGLSVPQRLVFLLVEAAGFDRDEVAHMLEIPLGAVTARLQRAHERLCGSS